MELTGKCKEDFEKWLKENNKDLLKLSDPSIYFSEIFSMSALFKYLTESMQYGVLEDFFSSVGIDVNIIRTSTSKKIRYTYEIYKQEKILHPKFSVYDVRNYKPEARDAAIEKANELYNL
jgi:hypothetical protein